MDEETLNNLLVIVEVAIKENDKKRLYWLSNKFKRLADQQEEIYSFSHLPQENSCEAENARMDEILRSSQN